MYLKKEGIAGDDLMQTDGKEKTDRDTNQPANERRSSGPKLHFEVTKVARGRRRDFETRSRKRGH